MTDILSIHLILADWVGFVDVVGLLSSSKKRLYASRQESDWKTVVLEYGVICLFKLKYHRFKGSPPGIFLVVQ